MRSPGALVGTALLMNDFGVAGSLEDGNISVREWPKRYAIIESETQGRWVGGFGGPYRENLT